MHHLAIPVLRVSDATAAEDFYRDKLGFRTVAANRDPARPNPAYLLLKRDAATIHLSSFSGDAVPGGVVFLIVDDVDALHAELVSKGVRIHVEPVNQTWGNREMYVKDPDGNCIRFVNAQGV